MIPDEARFDITVCSDSGYEDLIAEIYFRGEFVAVISQERGEESPAIEIHAPGNGRPWIFDLEAFEAAVRRARQRLYDLRRQKASGGAQRATANPAET